VLHSCTVEDGCLIGMGAILLDGVRVGAGSIVAAGCVLLENTIVPPRSLAAGIPGTVRKQLGAETVALLHDRAAEYALLAGSYLGTGRFPLPEDGR